MAAVLYMDSTCGANTRNRQSLYQNAMWDAGQLKNIIGLDKAQAQFDSPKAINQKDVALSVFVHSMCGAYEFNEYTGRGARALPKTQGHRLQVDKTPQGSRQSYRPWPERPDVKPARSSSTH